MKNIKVMLTCEHAGNTVPDAYKTLFTGAEPILDSHRGWDPGSLEIAQFLADLLHVELFYYPWTRLLVEINRSTHHQNLFSEFTRTLSQREKKSILDTYYHPYRDQINKRIAGHNSIKKRVIHIGVHTFTPIWDGKQRDVDIGLLYDPSHKLEKKFCSKWKQCMLKFNPGLRVRMNQPYKGVSDGLTTWLRNKYETDLYLGVELEVNQQYLADRGEWEAMCDELAVSLKNTLIELSF